MNPKVGMINLPTEEAVLGIGLSFSVMRVTQAKASWFSDSQRVAYYTPHHHGGYTEVYFVAAHPLKKGNCPGIRTCRFRDEAAG